MFGFLGEVAGFLKVLAGLITYLLAGGGAAMVGYLVGRWFSPMLGVILGAAVVGCTAFFYWAADDTKNKAYIKQLEAKQLELRLTAAALRAHLKEEREAVAHNEKVVSGLRKKLAAMPDKPECNIDGSIVDELNRIR